MTDRERRALGVIFGVLLILTGIAVAVLALLPPP